MSLKHTVFLSGLTLGLFVAAHSNTVSAEEVGHYMVDRNPPVKVSDDTAPSRLTSLKAQEQSLNSRVAGIKDQIKQVDKNNTAMSQTITDSEKKVLQNRLDAAKAQATNVKSQRLTLEREKALAAQKIAQDSAKKVEENKAKKRAEKEAKEKMLKERAAKLAKEKADKEKAQKLAKEKAAQEAARREAVQDTVQETEVVETEPEYTQPVTPGNLNTGGLTYDYAGASSYPQGQCTWGAKVLAPWAGAYWGNANMWPASAAAAGFRTGTTPRVGSVISWSGNHVAYVIGVKSANCIQVLESNYNGNMSIANYRGWFNPIGIQGAVTYIYPN